MNLKMSGFLQFIIGFILGIIFFTVGIAGGAYWFLTKVAVNPSKPIFPEEKPTPPESKPTETNTTAPVVKNETSTPPEETKNEETPKEELPQGAYRARVIWESGLSLRANPSKEAERIGGVGYNSQLIILSVSDDKQWQKVRIPGSGEEGWIKAGNIEKIND
jgi:hypothetical protein